MKKKYKKISKYPDGTNKLEGDIISKVIMNRNRDKDFVKRAKAVADYPESNMFTQFDKENFGEKNSHLMATGSDDKGQEYMFPTVMNPKNEAVKVPNQYAEYISSEGYKKATGMLEYKKGANNMKAKSKYKLKKKYVNGGVVGNADPTTLYGDIRKKSEVAGTTNFDNTQTGLANRDLTTQKLSDNTQAATQNVSNVKDKASATGAAVSSAIGTVGDALGAVPIVGAFAKLGQAGGDLGRGMDNTAGDVISDVANPSAHVMSGLENGNTTDLIRGFLPGIGTLLTDRDKTTEGIAKANEKYQKGRQREAQSQISRYGAVDDTMQKQQAKHGKKHLKYKMKGGTREIETEGREPIFSPKKTDGTRDLLYYNPNDPTHEKGGVKAKIVPKSSYKMRTENSDLKIPEGSAIVTANNDKNKQALDAYKKGNYKKLDKVINQMPEDNPKKKKDGGLFEADIDVWGNPKGNNLTVAGKSYISPTTGKSTIASIDEKTVGDENVRRNSNTSPVPYKSKPMVNAPTKETDASTSRGLYDKNFSGGGGYHKETPSTTVEDDDKEKSKLNLNGLAASASGLYNIMKGAFDKPVKTNRRYLKSEQYSYKDMSNPSRRAANDQYLADSANIRNATGGSSGSYLGNMALASNQKRKAVEDINKFESGRKTDIANKNVDIRNQTRTGNLGLANQYDDIDLQRKGKQSEYIGKGIEQLSNVAQMRELNKNRQISDDKRYAAGGTDDYDIEGKDRVKKKGSKNLKYKMKK